MEEGIHYFVQERRQRGRTRQPAVAGAKHDKTVSCESFRKKEQTFGSSVAFFDGWLRPAERGTGLGQGSERKDKYTHPAEIQ